MAILTGEGCKLYLGENLIGQRTSITGPSRAVAEIEVTHLDSTHKEFRPGLPETGTMSLEYEYDPANTQHAAIEDLMDSPSIQSWKLEYSNGYTLSFSGFPTSHETNGMTVESTVLCSVTIRITGAATGPTAPIEVGMLGVKAPKVTEVEVK